MSAETEREIDDDARDVQHDPRVRAAARTGFAASALLQILVGVLAIRVAAGAPAGQPDQSGALAGIATKPGGVALLCGIALACLLLALWFLLTAVLRHDDSVMHRWGKRVADGSMTLLYAAISVQSLRFAFGSGANSADTERRGTGSLLTVPGGPVVLGLIGAGTIAVGLHLVIRGVRRRFTNELNVPEGTVGLAVVALGVLGYVARGIAICAVGALLVIAAFTLDPSRATGLDGALHAFAALPFGHALLTGIGFGWCAAGLYGAVRAVRAPMH